MERRALTALKHNGNDVHKPKQIGNKKLGAANGAGALIILLPFGSDASLLEFSGLHRAFGARLNSARCNASGKAFGARVNSARCNTNTAGGGTGSAIETDAVANLGSTCDKTKSTKYKVYSF